MLLLRVLFRFGVRVETVVRWFVCMPEARSKHIVYRKWSGFSRKSNEWVFELNKEKKRTHTMCLLDDKTTPHLMIQSEFATIHCKCWDIKQLNSNEFTIFVFLLLVCSLFVILVPHVSFLISSAAAAADDYVNYTSIILIHSYSLMKY